MKINKIILLTLSLIAVSGCSDKEKIIPNFSEGDTVKSAISSDIGMIISRQCHPSLIGDGCRYDVRFKASQTQINTHLSKSDNTVQVTPLAVIKLMKSYELELVSKATYELEPTSKENIEDKIMNEAK
jgi:hypothetical protein